MTANCLIDKRVMRIIPRVNRNLVVLRDRSGRQAKSGRDLLRLMVCNEPFAGFVLGCLSDGAGFRRGRGKIAIPQQWIVPDVTGRLNVVRYTEPLSVGFKSTRPFRDHSWVVISDGRFVTTVDNRLICETLADSQADVVAVNIVAQMQASYEKVLTTLQNDFVGFRLFYEDATQPTPIPDDWPHHLFVRTSALNKLLMEGGLPLAFGKLVELCYSKSLVVRSTDVGGSVLDLATENGLLRLVQRKLGSGAGLSRYCADYSRGNNKADDIVIADSAGLFGKILLGKRVNIDEDAIIAGPTIVGNDVKIGTGAVVRASVISPGVSVQAGSFIEERVITDSQGDENQLSRPAGAAACPESTRAQQDLRRNNFREWSRFSYARFLKRVLDIVVAVVVLILFAPVLPIVMLAIKLTSPGPIFFRDVRQGLHGRTFECLKFRTMQVGADRMQDRLRVLNEADGPQFMVVNDPRLSAVGRFLRETYIDEIPQFINVMLGQMSVVGPRPSPESENRLCPFWRDARLSVRPGITGLWQVCRTRQPMRDFQEWIYYDVKYVRKLSLKLDLWICRRTAVKMAKNFVRQF